jgi:hypothetical protein
MAGDEGRFGRLGEIRSCWCPEGIRPTVAKQQVRQYVYAYAAVAPQVEDELNLGLVELLAEPERLRSLTFFPHLRMPV